MVVIATMVVVRVFVLSPPLHTILSFLYFFVYPRGEFVSSSGDGIQNINLLNETMPREIFAQA